MTHRRQWYNYLNEWIKGWAYCPLVWNCDWFIVYYLFIEGHHSKDWFICSSLRQTFVLNSNLFYIYILLLSETAPKFTMLYYLITCRNPQFLDGFSASELLYSHCLIKHLSYYASAWVSEQRQNFFGCMVYHLGSSSAAFN